MKVVVVGGGYAGLSCLMALADSLPGSERVLVDPGTHHLKLTRLHEALRRPLDDLRIPFAGLARRFAFRHVPGRPPTGPRAITRYARDRRLSHGDVDESFDILVVAVGARPRPRPRRRGCFGLSDLRRMEGRRLVERMASMPGRAGGRIVIVGGGATGLQYLFELRDALRRAGAGAKLTLVDGGSRLLPEQPRDFHDYVRRRLREGGIGYLPGYRLRDATPGGLTLVSRRGAERALACRHAFALTGLMGNPVFLETTETGQVILGRKVMPEVFAAGDCSRYRGGGLDTASAQAAVRKGRHVAVSITRLARGRRLRPYRARDLGFFLSIGILDGIGWMGDPRAVVTGAAAFAVREAIEARYDLFTRGVDTFQVL
jgi:NADH dehydrogenase